MSGAAKKTIEASACRRAANCSGSVSAYSISSAAKNCSAVSPSRP
jgi:hypothetical protein